MNCTKYDMMTMVTIMLIFCALLLGVLWQDVRTQKQYDKIIELLEKK